MTGLGEHGGGGTGHGGAGHGVTGHEGAGHGGAGHGVGAQVMGVGAWVTRVGCGSQGWGTGHKCEAQVMGVGGHRGGARVTVRRGLPGWGLKGVGHGSQVTGVGLRPFSVLGPYLLGGDAVCGARERRQAVRRAGPIPAGRGRCLRGPGEASARPACWARTCWEGTLSAGPGRGLSPSSMLGPYLLGGDAVCGARERRQAVQRAGPVPAGRGRCLRGPGEASAHPACWARTCWEGTLSAGLERGPRPCSVLGPYLLGGDAVYGARERRQAVQRAALRLRPDVGDRRRQLHHRAVVHLLRVAVVHVVHARLQRDQPYNTAVFQLGTFLRALRPARTVLHPARFTQHPARIIKKENIFFLQNVIAILVFSDNRCENAYRFVLMFSSIAHKIVPRPRFVRMLDCDRIFVVHV